MNITKIDSSHYRARIMQNGKTYSKNYHFKPTQKQAQKDLEEKIEKDNIYTDKFFQCATLYIESKHNILSPSTIKRYKHYLKSIPDDILHLPNKTYETIDLLK